jgi:hypothetical protein
VAQISRPQNHYHQKQADGKRSGLESCVATQLDSLGVGYQYEKGWIEYLEPATPHKYLPDFRLFNSTIIIETKGRFVTADRKKHLLIKAQHPALDIRFVFSNPNQRISKQSRTTYAMWCEKHGFKYAKQFIPKEWLL